MFIHEQLWLPLSLGLGLGLAQLLWRRFSFTSPVFKGPVRLYYWPATGRAETVRMLLAEAGTAFEDVSFEKPTSAQVYRDAKSFMEIKSSLAAQTFFADCRAKGGNSTNNTPMLEAGGNFYTQSTAIYRLVARFGGLYPVDPGSAYIVDNVLAHCEGALFRAK
jgi:glutathione S-transferase